MNKLCEIAKPRKLNAIIGCVFADNVAMVQLIKHLEFNVSSSEAPSILVVKKEL
jgi:hypothetical protein